MIFNAAWDEVAQTVLNCYQLQTNYTGVDSYREKWRKREIETERNRDREIETERNGDIDKIEAERNRDRDK